ncbi:P protein, partial [Galendromus occidentalis]|uniref:P protein n=1 Tax=Galendromus occidentalis TaxID=34638 RepID=A0AAJ7PAC5_9ACAR
MAAAVLVGLYALIIFELCHRTIAAMLGAAAAISCLALVGKRPDLNEVVSWLDIETLSLLFGMMIIVGIFGETGFFDYVAVLAFRLSKGKVWPMITVLCIFTAVISAFLDNVTTMLLLTAVTIRLCEVMDLDPKKVLIMLVMFSNVGGSATPIGDPPNVIIISNLKVLASGINFTTSILHLLPGVILSAFGVYVFLRVAYRDPRSLRKQSRQVVDGQRGTDPWHQAIHSSLGKSRGESLELSNVGRKLSQSESNDASDLDFERVLEDLSSKYKIRNRPLLIKSVIVLCVVILLFFLQSTPLVKLSLGWIAIFGAMTLLVLADPDDLEKIFGQVEWTTLLFFAALFVVMEALTALGLMQFIGEQTEVMILAVHEKYRLVAAILIVTWVSALASSFIDNIPFTTVMLKIVVSLGRPFPVEGSDEDHAKDMVEALNLVQGAVAMLSEEDASMLDSKYILQ